MPLHSTRSLGWWGYKTLLYLQRSSTFFLTFSSFNVCHLAVTFQSLWPFLPTFRQFYPSLSLLDPHCLSFISFTVFSTSLCWRQKCYATDIHMMMPWIWCLNTIISPPRYPPSPISLDALPWGGALCGKPKHPIVSAHISSFPVAQRTGARQCILIILTFKFAFLLPSLHHHLIIPLFLQLFSPFLLHFPFLYSPTSCSTL